MQLSRLPAFQADKFLAKRFILTGCTALTALLSMFSLVMLLTIDIRIPSADAVAKLLVSDTLTLTSVVAGITSLGFVAIIQAHSNTSARLARQIVETQAEFRALESELGRAKEALARSRVEV